MHKEVGAPLIHSPRKARLLSLDAIFARSMGASLAITISLLLAEMPLPVFAQLSGDSCQGPSNGVAEVVSRSTSSAAVGSTITIVGANFLGTTSVSINGTQAAFTVSSDSSIFVTVPNAASGELVITSSSGSYNAGVFSVLRRPDLVALNETATGSGKTEIHALSSDSAYQSSILDVATSYALNPANILQMADIDGDGRPDLVLVNGTATFSGKTEIHALSAASNYQTSILDVAVNNGLDSRNKFQVIDMDGDRKPDLVALNNGISGTDPTSIFVFSAASNYQTLIFSTTTPYVYNPANILQMSDIDGDDRQDLVLVNGTATNSGKTEIHALSAASNYQTSILDVAVNNGLDSRNKFRIIDMDSDGKPDLIALNNGISGTDPTSIFVFSAASNYQTLIFSTVTPYVYNPANILQLVNLNRK